MQAPHDIVPELKPQYEGDMDYVIMIIVKLIYYMRYYICGNQFLKAWQHQAEVGDSLRLKLAPQRQDAGGGVILSLGAIFKYVLSLFVASAA